MTMNPDLDPIQVLWVRGNLSRMEQLSVRSFLANGHPVHFYTYEPGENIPKGVVLRDAAEIVPEALAPAAPTVPFAKGSMGSFSDYFRYPLLSEKGGWWSDLDIVCLRPWRFAADGLTASTDERDHGVVANTCVMRFPKGHPVPRACRDVVRGFDLQRVGIDKTGPLLLNEQLRRLGTTGLMQRQSVFCPVPWNASRHYVSSFWSQFSVGEIKNRLRRPHLTPRFEATTVAAHLWHETWREQGWDKNARFPATSRYERYQRRWNRGD